MSLVNQMLQDLEQRRTAEAGVSPLGGLSASGVAVSTVQSVNYVLLGTILTLVFVVVFALLYLFGMKPEILKEPESISSVAEIPAQTLPRLVQTTVSTATPTSTAEPVIQPSVETREEESSIASSVQADVPVKSQVKEIERITPKHSQMKTVQQASLTTTAASDVDERGA